jgi:hypothetical protein
VSELTAVRVPVLPGADVRKARTGEPGRVVGPCHHAGTGQDGVCVEGPLPGQYTYYTLEAFSRVFEVPSDSSLNGPADFVLETRTEGAAAVPGKVADQTDKGKGF